MQNQKLKTHQTAVRYILAAFSLVETAANLGIWQSVDLFQS